MILAERVDIAEAPLWAIVLLFACQVSLALSLLALAYLSLTDRLRPNPYFGVRTKASRSSEAAWRHVHRRVVPFAFAGGLVALAGLVPMGLTTGSGVGFLVSLLTTEAVVLVLLLSGTAHAHRDLP